MSDVRGNGRDPAAAETDVTPSAMAPHPGRIGILGGTFDPIHLGHLAAGEEARERLGLERVLFVPAGEPWQKAGRAISPGADRIAMVELGLAGNPCFEVSTIEVDRPGPSYSVDTVEALIAAERSAGRDPDLWFILSAEAAHGLATWDRPDRLLALCRLAVVPRPGAAPFDPAELEAIAPGSTGRAVVLDGPRLDLSGTAIRARVRAGRSIRYLVPDPIAAYIAAHGLYRPSHQEEHPS
jgi:nicotinate-nucleotide adenylyltransferase